MPTELMPRESGGDRCIGLLASSAAGAARLLDRKELMSCIIA
ncbi:hypothetical protein ACQR1W_22850 [Bradyrhizobium sp. HKCCYLS1011]